MRHKGKELFLFRSEMSPHLISPTAHFRGENRENEAVHRLSTALIGLTVSLSKTQIIQIRKWNMNTKNTNIMQIQHIILLDCNTIAGTKWAWASPLRSQKICQRRGRTFSRAASCTVRRREPAPRICWVTTSPRCSTRTTTTPPSLYSPAWPRGPTGRNLLLGKIVEDIKQQWSECETYQCI